MSIAGLLRGRSFGLDHSGVPSDSSDAMRLLLAEFPFARKPQASRTLKPMLPTIDHYCQGRDFYAFRQVNYLTPVANSQ
jgi:hypothetical protein